MLIVLWYILYLLSGALPAIKYNDQDGVFSINAPPVIVCFND